ncbi:MAG: hypothetical protein ACTHKT_05960 [Solirubrobacterales bacterium]
MRSKLIAMMFVLFAVVALAGASGCGSSGSSGLTKKQFIKKADKFCEEGEREQLELAAKYLKKNPGAEEEEMIVPAALPPLQKQAEKIKALPAPEGDEAEIEAIVKAFEKAVKDTEANPGAVLSKASNPFEEANKLAEKYGLTICSRAP